MDTPGNVYVSIDVEADGPIPGPNSMLSLGAAAFVLPPPTVSREELERWYPEKIRIPIATFQMNLLPLPGAFPDEETMAWWKTQPEAWEACQADRYSPEEAMMAFVKWGQGLPDRPSLVGYPILYDGMWVWWYLQRFTRKQKVFTFSGVDIKTIAMLDLKSPYRRVSKKHFKRSWFEGTGKHSHVAVEDAIEQGIVFVNMMLMHADCLDFSSVQQRRETFNEMNRLLRQERQRQR